MALSCPRCSVHLAREDYESIAIERCPDCDGVWLDFHELKRVLELRGPAVPMRPGGKPVATAPEILCPLCAKLMERFNFKQTGILLDRCGGHGTWLDAGELDRVRAVAEKQVQAPRLASPPRAGAAPPKPTKPPARPAPTSTSKPPLRASTSRTSSDGFDGWAVAGWICWFLLELL